jgi:hypothetical protein
MAGYPVSGLAKPLGGGLFPVVEDVDFWGGYRVTLTTTTRDAIPLLSQKVGMPVFCVADGKEYRLTATGTPPTWVEIPQGANVSGTGLVYANAGVLAAEPLDVGGDLELLEYGSLLFSVKSLSGSTFDGVLRVNTGALSFAADNTSSITQAQATTGNGTAFSLTGQQGANVTGAAANKNGGEFQLRGGLPGTGGSGAAGVAGGVRLFAGASTAAYFGRGAGDFITIGPSTGLSITPAGITLNGASLLGAPTIASVSALLANVATPNVTITGTGFRKTSIPIFDGVPGTSVSVLNATSMVCTAPAHAAGGGSLVVENPDWLQSAALAITYAVPTFTSSTITGMAAWWKSSVGVTSSAGSITAIADQSGNGKNLTVTPATKPQLVTPGAIGGLPAIRMAGATYIQNTTLATAQPCTVYIVASQSDGTTSTEVLFDGKTNRLLFYQLASSFKRLYAGSTEFTMPITALAATGEIVCCVFNNGGTSAVYRNNSTTAVGTGVIGTVAFDGFTLGASATLASFWNGDYTEQMVFAGAHTQAQRAQVMAYLASQNTIAGVS